MRSPNLLSLSAAGLICALAAPALCASPTASAPPLPASLPVWATQPAQLPRLAAPASIGGYMIRPPKGYDEQTQPGPNGSTVYAWTGTARQDDKTRGYIMIGMFTPPPADGDKYTPMLMLERMVAAIAERRERWVQSKPERGTINGLPFVRMYWRGVDYQTGRPMRGVNYVTRDGATFIQLSSQDADPHAVDSVTLAEASILSFKKTPAGTPAPVHAPRV